MRDDCDESVDQPDAGDGGEKYEPEIDEDVDLLIDDVEWENTESVVVLDSPGWSVLAELTLGNFGEDSVHRVHPGVEVLLRHGKHVATKLGELVAQEHVREVDLNDNVDKVEKFAENKFHKVSSTPGGSEIMLSLQ